VSYSALPTLDHYQCILGLINKQTFIIIWYMDKMTPEDRKGRRGRPPKGQVGDTSGRILEAALGLFARGGYAGASIRKIAREVGITEGAIYAHFESKRAIYNALVAQAGPPVVLEQLASWDHPACAEDPESFVRALARRVVEEWDNPRARLFASVFMRESATGSDVGGTSILGAIEEVQRRLGNTFRRWMEEGLFDSESTPEHLVWELFAPIVYVRFVYLHGEATDEERRAGWRLVEEHVDHFVSSVFGKPKVEGP
jgi:AcrR family transcriptional regulator